MMTKNWRKKIQLKNILNIFFWSKIAIYLYLGLHKGVQATIEAFGPQKKHPSLQKMKIINFFIIFVGKFCPPGSGFGLRIRNRILTRDPIESGSTTLAMGIEKYISGGSRATELKVQNPRVVDWRIFGAPEGRPSGRRRWQGRRRCRPPPPWRLPVGPSWSGSPVHQVETSLGKIWKWRKNLLQPHDHDQWPFLVSI